MLHSILPQPYERAIPQLNEKRKKRMKAIRSLPLTFSSSSSSSSSSRRHRWGSEVLQLLPPSPELPARTQPSCPRLPRLALPRPRRRKRRHGLDLDDDDSGSFAGASAVWLSFRLRRRRRRRYLLLPHAPVLLESWPRAASPDSTVLLRRRPRRPSEGGRRRRGPTQGHEPVAARLPLPPQTPTLPLLRTKWRRRARPSCGPRPGRPRGSRSLGGAAPVSNWLVALVRKEGRGGLRESDNGV